MTYHYYFQTSHLHHSHKSKLVFYHPPTPTFGWTNFNHKPQNTSSNGLPFFCIDYCLPCVYDFLIFFSKYIPPNSSFHVFPCYHTLVVTTGVRSGMIVEWYTSLVGVRVRVMYQDFYTSPFETSIFTLPFCIIILWYIKILHFSTKPFLKN